MNIIAIQNIIFLSYNFFDEFSIWKFRRIYLQAILIRINFEAFISSWVEGFLTKNALEAFKSAKIWKHLNEILKFKPKLDINRIH